MPEIIPAIMPKNYEDLKNKISLVRGVVSVTQIDICDGVLVQNKTWPYAEGDLDSHFKRILNEAEGLPFWEDIDFELDLMVSDAMQNFDIYTKLGPRRVVLHEEAFNDIEEFRNFLEGIDNYVRDVTEIGVAIGPTVPVDKIFPLLDSVDFVQVMGIDKEGVQGEEFDPRCIDHVKKLKEKFPGIVISVDGGVDLETASPLLEAGVDRLIVGSAIFGQDDIIGTIEYFRNL